MTGPVRFRDRIAVTLQDLGWTPDGRYIGRQNDSASVAYWYQALPTGRFREHPSPDELILLEEPHPQ